MSIETPQYVPKQESSQHVEEITQDDQEKLRLREQVAEERSEKERFQELAYRDDLTGLLNRKGLKEELERESLGNSPEKGKTTSGSMLVLDVDNFKVINDAFGHPVGDQVLQAVARHLHDNTRTSDLVARWGGEEFVVVFDKTDEKGILEKLYERKEGEEVGRSRINVETEIEGKPVTITLSGGVTDFNLNDNLDEVFKRADEALYHAKRSGKDRIMGATVGK